MLAALLAAGGTHAHATTATISPEGNLLIDGEPFFPIGIYHVSWIGNRQGGKAVPDLHLAADAGFNLIHPDDRRAPRHAGSARRRRGARRVRDRRDPVARERAGRAS